MPGVVDKQNFMAMNLSNKEVVKKPGECATSVSPVTPPSGRRSPLRAVCL